MTLNRYSRWIPSLGRYAAEGEALGQFLLPTADNTPVITPGYWYFVVFSRENKEPTSGLEPLTCSLQVSCSRDEKATRAATPCCWSHSILCAATRSKRTSRVLSAVGLASAA